MDSNQHIFVSDNDNIQEFKYAMDGTGAISVQFVSAFGTSGIENPGDFNAAFSLFSYDTGKIAVSDCNNHRIQLLNWQE